MKTRESNIVCRVFALVDSFCSAYIPPENQYDINSIVLRLHTTAKTNFPTPAVSLSINAILRLSTTKLVDVRNSLLNEHMFAVFACSHHKAMVQYQIQIPRSRKAATSLFLPCGTYPAPNLCMSESCWSHNIVFQASSQIPCPTRFLPPSSCTFRNQGLNT